VATQGTATINFGATPVGSGSFVINDATLTGLTYAEAFFVGSDTHADNNAAMHKQAGALMRVTCDAPSGANMTVTAESLFGLVTGNFVLRYVAN
jgi:hypothetical protein